ncbi:type II toxin-antitoxin system RelE/ParE family toxin [Cellvibrio sp. pealriver]|uniref:type II toxin-antitoxin system RelE/ParE family toxin n=1 Tax=Cellvibrio sp. pealriver TaxID=1622269 RepID=UPI00066FDC55|nr:type II toxin-antitoxin system RelE/ParE family toxin [Cellvibrio sp. pealriver]
MYSILTTEEFDKWFTSLRDRKAKTLVQVRINRMEDGNFGDCQSVGNGVSELRIHHGAGYRIYFKRSGLEIIVLLVGGDKSSQPKDIKWR